MSTLEAEHFDFAIALGLDALQAFLLPSAGIPLPREGTLGVPVVGGATVRYRVGTPIVEAAGGDAGKVLLRSPLELSIQIGTQTTRYEDGEAVLTGTPANRGPRDAILAIGDSDRALSTHDLLDPTTVPPDQTAPPPPGVTMEQLEQIVQAIVTETANAVGAIPLHRPLAGGTADAADEAAEIAVRFAEGSGDELHLLIRTGTSGTAAGTGRIEPFLAAFENSGLLLRNGWLLQFLILPALQGAFPGAMFDFSDSPPSIASNTDPLYQQGDKKIHNIAVTVDPGQGRLAFTGEVSDRGTGWKATGTFSFFMTLNSDADGILGLVTTEPVVQVKVEMEWWRTLAGIVGAVVLGAVGFVIGGPAAGPAIAYAMVGAFLGFILGGKFGGDILEEFFTQLANGALAGAVDTATAPFRLGPLKDFDLPVTIDGITLGDVHLENVTKMTGRIRRRTTAPIFGQGTPDLQVGQAVDLDTGRLDAGGLPDLVVEDAGALGVRIVGQNGTLFAPVGGEFGPITPDDLATLAYTQPSVLAPRGIPPLASVTVTFAARTSEGLFAKLQARRERDRVAFRYVTYAVSAPRHMTIEGDARVVDREAGVSPPGGGRGLRTSVQQEGWYWAEHFDLVAPLRYEWSFDGTPLAPGQETAIESGAVATAFGNGQVRITTAMGVNLDGRLSARVTDARNQTATASRYVALRGWEIGFRPGGGVFDPGPLSEVDPPGGGPRPFPGRPPILGAEAIRDVIARAAAEETDLSKELVGAVERGRQLG
ncbi:MAG TPA: hypothetical protein VF715_11490 [Thermoleophilaceae bacterium]